MSSTDHQVEQEILRHEAHLKRIDELFEQAKQAAEGAAEPDPLLAAVEKERDELASLLKRMRGEAPDDWREAAEQRFGPLAIWEALARIVEHSIERLEKR